MIPTLALALLMQAAAPPDPAWNCADPQFQQEMNWCAGQDYEAADQELNAQWAITRAAMTARDADWAPLRSADKRPGWSASLLAAQRGWLRYRDAHCALEGYEARGGSLEPLLVLTCKAQATRARTAELKALVERPDG
ncbi:MAG: lysozyme inhibitor LprI family protein [Porphyrobacter sp.]|jgi:uncharacterized protein YecT (DUF1311 family)|nr:lysozyme inhibitor LprI family protein [Porphyrobacter sp.]